MPAGRVSLALAVAITGCTRPIPPAADAPPPSLAGRPDCFFARDVQDFRAVDRGTLLVFAPDRQRAYRVTVAPPSFRLGSASGIAFVGNDGRICGRAGERLLLGGASTGDELAVVDVRRLDPAAVDLAAPRSGGRPAPAPEPGPGAAIEPDADDLPP